MKKLSLLIVLFVLGVSALLAQTKVITGTITSAVAGEGPIPGVTVQVKGTTIGTTSDINGKYTLTVPENATTLIFSYIGMKKQEIEIAGRSVINGTMESDLLAWKRLWLQPWVFPERKRLLAIQFRILAVIKLKRQR